MKLLSVGNPKTLKGMDKGFNTYILHLAPASLSGHNTCAKATVGCKAACLNLAGRGGMFKKGEVTNVIQQARIRKTKMFFDNRVEFMEMLVADIELAIKQSKRLGLTPVFRLNGTSDLAWEKYSVIRNGVEFQNIFKAFAEVIFYDYTKILGRRVSGLANYSLTFSAADGNDADIHRAISEGLNIAVVFGVKKTQPLPESYLGRPVFNGD
jgi:hypothetical protein